MAFKDKQIGLSFFFFLLPVTFVIVLSTLALSRFPPQLYQSHDHTAMTTPP